MELKYDARIFEVAFGKRLQSSVDEMPRIWLVLDEEERVFSAWGESVPSDWVGKKIPDLALDSGAKAAWVSVIRKKDWDHALTHSLGGQHGQEQKALFKERFKVKCYRVEGTRWEHARAHRALILKALREHFFIELVSKAWSRFMPSTSAVFIQLHESSSPLELVLVFKKGQLESYFIPEVKSDLKEETAFPDFETRVQGLSDRLLLKVQGISVPLSEWQNWSRSDKPLKSLAKALRRGGKAKLSPARWMIRSSTAASSLLWR